MSSLVTDIVSHIETQIITALPGSFAKAKYIYNPAAGKRKEAESRYSVRPLSGVENNLNLGSYAVDHDFEVMLTNTYKSTKLLNDYDMSDKIIALQDYCHDIFKQIKSTTGTAQIRQVFNINIQEPDLDTENHIITQGMTLTIKYQNSLK